MLVVVVVAAVVMVGVVAVVVVVWWLSDDGGGGLVVVVVEWEPFIDGQAAPFDPKYYRNWEKKPGSETPAAMMKRKREEAKRIEEKNACAQNLA
ncbi:hypothetical protein RHGRI_031951 [Rhododendron griersonianum]|uniref:Secreted protein n=1 Tax=Rhododendron griersonianum TaxID=479676 RepID=A0AAV6I9Y9_9ERIC|nr:hypothetical protein RHGRI_031951 [Rhododendron griersonianum]